MWKYLIIWAGLTTALFAQEFDPKRLVLKELEGDTRFHHAGTITSVTVFSDGQRVVTTAQDGTARIWDLTTGKEIQRFYHKKGQNIWDVELYNNETELFTSGSHQAVSRWDIATGNKLQTYKHKDSVFRITLSPDKKYMAAADRDNIAIVWNIETGEERFRLEGHKDSVYDVLFTPDGQTIITASDDDTIRTWNASDGVLINTKKEEYGDVYTLALSPDQSKVLVCSENQAVTVMPTTLNENLWAADIQNDIRTAAWSHDGLRIAAVCDDNRLYILDANTGEILGDTKLPGSTNWGVTFTPNDQFILTGCGHVLCRFDSATGARIFPPPDQPAQVGAAYAVVDINDLDLRIETGAATGLIVRTRSTGEIRSTYLEEKTVTTIAHSKDQNLLAAAGDDGTIWLLTPDSGKEVKALQHGDDINALRFTQQGTRLISGGDDRKVKIWDPRSGELIHTLEGHKSYVRGLHVSRDGVHLASTGSRVIKLWDVDAGTLIQSHEFESESLGTLRFNPIDDRTILLTGREGIYYWPYPAKTTNPEAEPKKIEHLISQLGAPTFRTRAKATSSLINTGPEILPFLKEADSDDPEVVHRIKHIARMLAQRNVYPIDDLFQIPFEETPSSVAWHPDGVHWAATEGIDAQAKIVLGTIANGKPVIARRIKDGHSPHVISFTDARSLRVANRDGSRSLYSTTTP